MSDETFISRWSRRKSEAKRDEPAPGQAVSAAEPEQSTADPVPAKPGTPLPPVESLTPESDFTPFLGKDVDGELRQRALKTLFQDPRFNRMDGLDVYIDDYSKPDPLPEGWLEKMNQVARLGEYHEPEAPPPGEEPGEVPGVAAVPANEASLPAVEAAPASDTSAAPPPLPSMKES